MIPAQNPRRARYAIGAWLVAIVPSLAFFLARVASGAGTLRPPSGALDPLVLGYSVLVAPLLETALMLALAELLALGMPRHAKTRIALLAAIGALAHLPGGGWPQVVSSLWPFLVYSVTMITWMQRSKRDAFTITAVVHALYNATFVVVGVMGFRLAGGGPGP